MKSLRFPNLERVERERAEQAQRKADDEAKRLWLEGRAKLRPLGETISPPLEPGPPKRGRPPGPKPDPKHIDTARAAGYRCTRRSDGWVVVPPMIKAAYLVRSPPFPNATRAWQAAYHLATGKW